MYVLDNEKKIQAENGFSITGTQVQLLAKNTSRCLLTPSSFSVLPQILSFLEAIALLLQVFYKPLKQVELAMYRFSVRESAQDV